jgi:hypothetical protein
MFSGFAAALLWFTLPAADFTPPPDVPTFEHLLEKRAIRFFIEQAHPHTGLIAARAPNFGERDAAPSDSRKVSIASTGFGLAVLANAADRHMIARSTAENIIRRALRSAMRMAHFHGWLYHFVDPASGRRWDAATEFSTIDTALLVAGALYAGQVFPGGEIDQLARALYERLDFTDMLTDGGTRADKLTLSMGYAEPAGYISYQWDMYAEELILLLLGLGHPTRPLPQEAWLAWQRSPRAIAGTRFIRRQKPVRSFRLAMAM